MPPPRRSNAGRITAFTLAVFALTSGSSWLGTFTKARVSVEFHSQPSVTLEPQTIALGEHLWGQLVQFQLHVINSGAHPDKITKVSPDCDCTSSGEEYVGRVLKPREAATLDFTLEARLKPGHKASKILIGLDSGAVLTATVDVDVMPAYVVTPDAVDFGDVDMNGAAPAQRLITFEPTEAKFVGVSADAPWLAIHKGERVGCTEILLEALPQLVPPGRSSANVIFKTDDDVRPEFAVLVHARGVQDLVPEPLHVFLAGSREERVMVYDRENRPVKLMALESGDPRVHAELLEDGGVAVWRDASVDDSTKVTVWDDKGRSGRFLVSVFD